MCFLTLDGQKTAEKKLALTGEHNPDPQGLENTK